MVVIPQRIVRMLILYLVSMLGWTILTMTYINRVARESERKWCGMVTLWDDAYRSTPPTTPLGKDVATEMARLRSEFHC